MINLSFFKKDEDIKILLDIGTESVKALLFKKEGSKIHIISDALEYFDYYGTFDFIDFNFNKEILKKTILKAIENFKIKKNKPIILGLPANILKARICWYNLKRENFQKIINKKEEISIFKTLFEQTKKIVLQQYSEEFGILPEELEFLNLKILESKIDGYKVNSILKYRGKNLDFKVLITFLPKNYLKRIKEIIESLNLKIESINHIAEGVDILSEKIFDGILLDIGGCVTQIYLIKNCVLEKIEEISLGGNNFSKALSEKLGLNEIDSKILKERYSQKQLSPDSLNRLKEIFSPVSQIWFEQLTNKMFKISGGSLLPFNIFIFGGGSLLPEIADILKNGNWNGFLGTSRPLITFLSLKDKITSNSKIKNLKNSQITSLLLLAYAKKSY